MSITANYPGTCLVCQRPISPGTQVDKMPGGFGWRHAGCEAPADAPPAPETAPEDLQRAVAYLTQREVLKRISDFEASLLAQYRKTDRLSVKQVVAVLKKIEKAEADRDSAGTGSNVDTSLPDVPEGKYALDHQGEALFFEVDRPTAGKWAGRVFLNQLIGDNRRPVKDLKEKRPILELIHQDVEGAARRYGHYRRECGFCNIGLTDPFSRFFGVGPVCRKKHGMPISRAAYIRRAREQGREGMVAELVAWEKDDPDIAGDDDPQLALEAC